MKDRMNKTIACLSFLFLLFITYGIIGLATSERAHGETVTQVVYSGSGSITTNGIYQLASDFTGTISIASTITEVKIIGNGSEHQHANTNIIVAGDRTEALKLTIEDLNIAASSGVQGIDFSSAGSFDHKLYLSGVSKIFGGTNRAGIHLPSRVSLIIDSVVGGTAGEIHVTGGNQGAGIGGGTSAVAGTKTVNGGTITVNGGIVNATGGSSGAGIGGGIYGSGGTVTINGGTVTARGGSSGAGIGGGAVGSGDTVTINGGIVNASGGNLAAGIGGGSYGVGGTVTINGGTVTAAGVSHGPGIGGGFKGAGGTVTINGGTVIATGGTYGAGIGGGSDGSAGSGTIYGGAVTINGGTVTATGGFKGAGIGGSLRGSGGTATITGGTVTARGGSEGAGIGGGTNGAGGTVSIRGINTRVTAMGTSGGRDIGSGDSSSDGGTLEVLEGASVDITNTNSQIKLSLRDFSTDPEGGADVLDPISLSVNIDGIFLDTPNGQILFKANGEEVGRAFIEGEGMNLYGTAGMEVDDLLGGNYTFLVEYVPGAGDRFFSSDQIEITNYAISKFSQAPLTFNIPETITYGNEPFDIQVSGGSGTGDISYEVTSGNAVTVDNVGRVTIVGAGEAEVTVTKTGDDYYNEASVSIVIEVNKAIPTVTFPTAITISYGQTLSDSEFRLGVGDGAFAWKEPDTIPIVHNQGYIVVFTPNDPVNYDYSGVELEQTVAVIVTPKPLNIEAEDKSKVYGDEDPQLTYEITVEELVGMDVISGSLIRVAGEDVGSYKIQQGDLTAGANYTITFIEAELIITPKTLTVTAHDKSKVYGEADPQLTYEITVGALLGMDVISGSLIREAGEAVGSYKIQQVDLTAGANYTITFLEAELTITPKTLTVTAHDKSKVYGEADPQLTYEITVGALLGMDVISGSLIREAGEAVGSYKIQQGDLTAGANYSITFTEAELTITPKTLTITVDDKSKVYGEADPPLTYEITVGALLGMDVISGSLIREAGEDVGSYKIQQGDLTAGANYTITFTEVELIITPKTLTVTAHDKSKVHGKADPDFTVSYDGFVFYDNSNHLDGILAFTREVGEAVGTYTITPSGLTSGNYHIDYVSGVLTITRAAATTGGGGYVPPSPQQKFNGEIYISTIKTVTEEGKQRHTATVSSQAMNNAVKNALKAEISSLNLILEKEQESPADEVQFSLPADILLSLVENNISLKITTSLGVLEIPHNTLLALSRHEVDLKIEMERISEETGEEARQLAREAGGQPLGDSTRIKANITGKTVVTLSLEGVELPVDPAERQSFLDALAVFIYHSDGSTESIVGEIDYDDEGNPVGISIWVDKFSDFVIVKMPQKIILLTVGSEKAQVDGVTTELDAIPFIKQPFNRTLVPVRFVGEILGADVQWLPETKQVLIMYRGREILLTIDSQTVLVDGEEQQLDCPAEIVGNRTFVPLRFVSETLGAQVEWDAATQSITINP